MKKTAILSALVAVLAVFMFGLTSAFVYTNNDAVVVNFNGVDVNHVHPNPLNMAGFAGETVPVKVTFLANNSVSDVKIKVEIYGGNEEYTDSTGRFNVVNGSVYTKTLNLQLPKNLKDTTRDLILKVRVYNPDFEYITSYNIAMQRNSYQLNVISLDYDNTVAAGDSVPVSVVVKNRGFENSDDGFVVITIPELGVYAKGYFGDLVAVENCSLDCDEEDSVQKVLSLTIPQSANSGVYEMIVTVYDEESTTVVTDLIKVSASQSTQALSSQTSQSLKAGEQKTYELILVNSADKIMVYELKAVSGSELSVSVPSLVVVEAGASKTVEFTVKANSDAEKGVYPFVIQVNGESKAFSANVEGKSVSVSAVVLTILLVIVFVALLVVLIVLLTKKDKEKVEEVETSYY